MMRLLLIYLSLLVVTTIIAQKKPNSATFEWFEYIGNDSIYNTNDLEKGQYYNPILQGYYPDPSICKKGKDFYLVNSSFSHFPGIPIFHSTNLVNWQQIGHVLDRPSQLNLDNLPMSNGIFAPAIEYNANNNTFYLVSTLVGGGGNFLVKAKKPEGPWSDPIWLPEVTGIDPSLFFDEDGKAYIVNNREPAYSPIYSGHRAVWIHEFDVSTDKTTGTPKVLIDGGIDISAEPQWIEGPHLYKINSKYYLMAAEGGTSINHSEVILRADSPWGPYEIWDKNPILTQRSLDPNRSLPVTNAGHADLIQDIDGKWWSVFLACRPYEENLFNIGRETFLLPVNWQDGWPIILEPNESIPLIGHKPNITTNPSSPHLPNGNFIARDDFNKTQLGYEWVYIRTPHKKWYQLDDNSLTILCEPISINDRKNPAFIARRQQHHNFQASTLIHFKPQSQSESAGLVCYQNEKNYYYLGIFKKGDNSVVRLIKSNKNQPPSTLAESPIETNSIKLKVIGEGAKLHFAYAIQKGDWNYLIKDVDSKHLSTHFAGGFIGTIIGMYATSSEP